MAKNVLEFPWLAVPNGTTYFHAVDGTTDYRTTVSGIHTTIFLTDYLLRPFRMMIGDVGVSGALVVTGVLRVNNGTFVGTSSSHVHRMTGKFFLAGPLSSTVNTDTSSFAGHVNVSGNTNFGTNNVSHNTKITGGLTVSSSAKFYDDLFVNKNITFSGSLLTTGSLRIGSSSSNNVINGSLTVSGLTMATQGFLVDGLSVFHSRVNVDNSLYCQSFTSSGDITATNDLFVNNNATLLGNLSVGGDLDIIGALRSTAGFVTQGNSYFGTDSTHNSLVAGNIFIQSGLGVKGDLLVTGNSSLGGLTAAGETIAFNNSLGKVTIANNLFVTNNIALGAMNLSGGATISGTLYHSGQLIRPKTFLKKQRVYLIDQATTGSYYAASSSRMHIRPPSNLPIATCESGDYIHLVGGPAGLGGGSATSNGVFKVDSVGTSNIVVLLPVVGGGSNQEGFNIRACVYSKSQNFGGWVSGLWSATWTYSTRMPWDRGFAWDFDTPFWSADGAYFFRGNASMNVPAYVDFVPNNRIATPNTTNTLFFGVFPITGNNDPRSYWGSISGNIKLVAESI